MVSKKSRSSLKKPLASIAERADFQPAFHSWFRDSATIVVARITAFGGFITGVLGALDWSPLLGASGMSQRQIISMGAIILAIGVSHEIARRRTIDA